MFKKIITVDANPPMQFELHYKTRESLIRSSKIDNGFVWEEDDFGQIVQIGCSTPIIGVAFIDIEKDLEAQSLIEIDKLKAHEAHAHRVESDPILFAKIQEHRRQQALEHAKSGHGKLVVPANAGGFQV